MFRLRMLGGLALERGNGLALAALPKRRAEAVLAVLAVCGDLGCTRERLFALLWPESDDARSRHGLRDALHTIRRVLGPGAVTGGHLLRLDATIVDSDVHALRQAMTAGRLADAVRAYTGPLLDGFHVDGAPEFEQWLDGERARMAREQAEALDQLARRAAADGAWADAAGWCARAVEHDPLNSHLVLRHAEALAAMGDRANAVKVAEAHALRLREELDLEPDSEFMAEIERMRRGKPLLPRTSVKTPAPSPSAEAPQPADDVPALEPSHDSRADDSATGASLSVGWKRWPPWIPWVAAVAVIVGVGGVFAARYRPEAKLEAPHRPRTAIAVLPFRSLSADSSSAYFAAGLHDELVMQLTRVASLTVIGRTSVGGYQETSKPLRQIGDELGVGSIVEASVQVDGRRLRVIVRLLDPVTQADLWTERYERTLDDAFAVQSAIAQGIVAGVGAALSSTEAQAIAAAPTRNAQAYHLYLQALQYERRPGVMPPNLAIAQQLCERAVMLDSAFAQAHARLAIVHFGMWYLRYDRTAARLEQARREAQTARRLGPELPQAHLAVGLTHHFTRDAYREALEEFNLAVRRAPGDAELWRWIGRAHRGLGSWDSALVAFGHAQRLDPVDQTLFMSIGNTLHALRRYPEAIEAYRQALALGPDVVQTRLSIAWSYILWKGQLDTLRAVTQGLPQDGNPGGGGAPIRIQRVHLLMMERRADSVLSVLRVINKSAGADARSFASWSAQAHLLRGDTVAARAAFDSAAVYLDSMSRAHPDDADLHESHGAVLAALGRRDHALREARWLARHNKGTTLGRALILARVGEVDAALAVVERLLSTPTPLSVHYLRLDPQWDAIVRDPRAARLLAKYADPGS